jgi:hypothetical protein
VAALSIRLATILSISACNPGCPGRPDAPGLPTGVPGVAREIAWILPPAHRGCGARAAPRTPLPPVRPGVALRPVMTIAARRPAVCPVSDTDIIGRPAIRPVVPVQGEHGAVTTAEPARTRRAPTARGAGT